MSTDDLEEPSALEQCAELFANQHAVAADRQVRALGVTARQQKALIERGLWYRFCHGVLGTSGAPTSWEQQVMAAILAVPGAVACGRTAARLHEFDGFRKYGGIKIAAGRSARIVDIPGVRYSRLRPMTADDLVTIRGIPSTSAAVTLIHLVTGGHNAGKALDDALRRGAKPAELRADFERWKGRGVRGPSEVLELLADRVDRRLPRSWYQRVAKAIFEMEAIHLVDEWPVHDENGRHLADLDLADVDLKVGVECQSWEWHGSPSAQYRDIRRKRRLTELGWDIVEVWWSDLRRSDEVIAHLRRCLANAMARNRVAETAEDV